MFSKELLKGTLKTIVLKLLTEHKELYGYEISQLVKRQTEGKLVLTEGALYPTLHQLEQKGLLSSRKLNVGNRTRKYYSLTTAGQEASGNRLQEFQEFLAAMQLILKSKPEKLV